MVPEEKILPKQSKNNLLNNSVPAHSNCLLISTIRATNALVVRANTSAGSRQPVLVQLWEGASIRSHTQRPASLCPQCFLHDFCSSGSPQVRPVRFDPAYLFIFLYLYIHLISIISSCPNLLCRTVYLSSGP